MTIFFLTGCSPDDPVIPNEEEVITSVKLTLIPIGASSGAEFSYTDFDGDGGNDPVITFDTLEEGKTYKASLSFLNEIEDPTENITEEIEEEAQEHQVFLVPSDSSAMTIIYMDNDGAGYPLGIKSQFTTKKWGDYTLQVILRHQPDKNAEGVSDGDPTNAGGETDIEVNFSVYIR